LAFARRQVIEPKVLDANSLIRRLDTVFRRTMGERVKTQLTLSATGRVRADESQLEQVVMNLVTNARDAMPGGGVLTVETLDVEVDSASALLGTPGLSSGRYVSIEVSDTGPGIPPEALPRVFEPFYTTRTSGTGLGLATCYGIVKQSGGHIAVHSEPGRGTTFKVYFPRVEGEVEQSGPRSGVGAATGERILLIEDEAPVRSVVERTLRRHGYHVVSAGSAEEAAGLLDAALEFDVLVTDVVLPGMGGRAFADQLLQRMPGLRILFVSGYAENAIVHGGVLEPGIHFLQKPFVPSDLLAAVRRILA
jgi:CheY-like chemotaxis protein